MVSPLFANFLLRQPLTPVGYCPKSQIPNPQSLSQFSCRQHTFNHHVDQSRPSRIHHMRGAFRNNDHIALPDCRISAPSSPAPRCCPGTRGGGLYQRTAEGEIPFAFQRQINIRLMVVHLGKERFGVIFHHQIHPVACRIRMKNAASLPWSANSRS